MMQASELGARRMIDHELFLESKRALNPRTPDMRPYSRAEGSLEYSSRCEQLPDLSIADEIDYYINIAGVLYSFISLKDVPDATLPGILGELVELDFPITVNAQHSIPDQTKVLKNSKSRLRKMQA